MKVRIPNGPVFSSQDSLNSYKIGDHKQKLHQYQKEQTALSQLTHRMPSSVPAARKSSSSSWLWVAMLCAGTGSQAGNVAGIHSPQVIPWPEPWAGKGSPAAGMLQAGSAGPGMVDAPRLVPQGWDCISNSICALLWTLSWIYQEPLYILYPSACGISPEFFWTGVLQKLHIFISSNKALKHLINFKHTNSLTTPGYPHAWN